MRNRKLAIVIPVFKQQDKIRRCLEALRKSNYQDFNIIIVDHAGNDQETHWIRTEYPEVFYLQGSPELWWSGATNIGVNFALEQDSDLIMLLNHDCYVHNDTIGNLLNSLANDKNKIVAPVQYDTHTKKELVCATTFFLLGFPTILLPAKWCKTKYRGDLIPTSLIIGGRGAIIHSDIFKRVGLFDEKTLPHYGADHDFYLRCKKSDVRLYICRSALIDVDSNDISIDENDNVRKKINFISSLRNRNSHRNIYDTWALFSNYYSFTGFAFIGIILYLLRYSIMYFTALIFNRCGKT